jgi:hypothetical protein
VTCANELSRRRPGYGLARALAACGNGSVAATQLAALTQSPPESDEDLNIAVSDTLVIAAGSRLGFEVDSVAAAFSALELAQQAQGISA